MGSEHLVVDLSSDDEDCGVGEPNGTAFKWVEKLLAGEDEESDDVVIVDELSGPPVVKVRRNLDIVGQKEGDFLGEESDDDCLVLDSDPDKSMRVVDDKVDRVDGEDDLVVVQEKGQVACRDFPHPRHHCANFPFNSSEHVQHCKLCHCYVCDCLAPCKHWGNGELPSDHCHSTDKVEMWKSQRLLFKRKSISHSDKFPDNTLTTTSPLQNLGYQYNQVSLTTPMSTTNPLRPCSGAGVRSHSLNDQSHNQLPSPFPYRNQRYTHCSVGPNPPRLGAHSMQRERHNSSYLAPQVAHRTPFKRAAMTQARLNSSSRVNGISNNQIPRPIPTRSHPITSTYLRSQHPQPGLRTSDYLTSAATGVGVNQQAGLGVSEGLLPFPATLPAYQQQLGTSVGDDNLQNWQTMVANVANDLGVSSNITENTFIGDNIAIYPPNYTSAIPQMNTDQYSNIYPQYAKSDDLNPLGNYTSQVNNFTMDNIAEHRPGEEPEVSTLEMQNSLPRGCNIDDASVVSLDSLFASAENEMFGGPAIDMPLPELDPESLFFDIGDPWSSFPEIQNNS